MKCGLFLSTEQQSMQPVLSAEQQSIQPVLSAEQQSRRRSREVGGEAENREAEK